MFLFMQGRQPYATPLCTLLQHPSLLLSNAALIPVSFPPIFALLPRGTSHLSFLSHSVKVNSSDALFRSHVSMICCHLRFRLCFTLSVQSLYTHMQVIHLCGLLAEWLGQHSVKVSATGDIVMRLLVHRHHVGQILGHKGEIVQGIEARTGARVHITEVLGMSTEQMAEVSGL